MNANRRDRTETKVLAQDDAHGDAPNPLWIIVIGMAVFFGATAAIIAAG